MRRALLALVVLALAPAGARADELSIYSSLPLQGDARPQALDVVRGMRLALEEHGGMAGPHRIRYLSLDDSTAAAGMWDPAAVARNARRAAQDPTTIAYLGEFNSGASAITIPILNEGGILTVSPSNTYVGLTRAEGADRGEPRKYYPTGVRTYGRVVPADHIQATALARWVRSYGVTRPYVIDDGEVYGHGLASMVVRRMAALGLRLAGRSRTPARRPGSAAARIARRAKAAKADAIVYAGITQNDAAKVLNAVGRRVPGVLVFASDGVAEERFTRHALRGLRPRLRLTDPALPPADYGAAGAAFADRFRQRWGHAPEPYAIFGYEAMAVVLDAVAAAGPDRQRVIDAFFATRDRDSVLGRYSIDAHGDTTLAPYGGLTVSPGGRLLHDTMIDASPIPGAG
ncbi:MAG: branched-chain amino acid ABC transporter substrate-binding protein [Solirubrobacterales bacterium]|nr:branched-chain amino acid ABC transporter substrate-binding protein [Solirubrobacterales bacterium]